MLDTTAIESPVAPPEQLGEHCVEERALSNHSTASSSVGLTTEFIATVGNDSSHEVAVEEVAMEAAEAEAALRAQLEDPNYFPPEMFIVKNLDTQETFRIEEIDKHVERGIDPVALRIAAKGGEQGVDDEVHEPVLKNNQKQKKKEKMSAIELAALQSDVRTTAHKKNERVFYDWEVLQDLKESSDPIWALVLSLNGQYLASGGQDTIVRVWKVVQATPNATNPAGLLFEEKPCRIYCGHTADILALAWSKNSFLLSSSMDKTVKLWHISRDEGLCTFKHVDFVTCISFHPRDDKYFLSGSLDEKLRVWNIPEKRVVNWIEAPGMITAASFTQDGTRILCGTYHGVCSVHAWDNLRYITTLNVRSKRGKNSKGRKITGIVGHPTRSEVMISTNDSRVRVYRLDDFSQVCKYKGLLNKSSQIRATYSEHADYVVCGSEDENTFIWNSVNPHQPGFQNAFRKGHNESYEAFHGHQCTVTATIFAKEESRRLAGILSSSPNGAELDPRAPHAQIIISSDVEGVIRVFKNRSLLGGATGSCSSEKDPSKS